MFVCPLQSLLRTLFRLIGLAPIQQQGATLGTAQRIEVVILRLGLLLQLFRLGEQFQRAIRLAYGVVDGGETGQPEQDLPVIARFAGKGQCLLCGVQRTGFLAVATEPAQGKAGFGEVAGVKRSSFHILVFKRPLIPSSKSLFRLRHTAQGAEAKAGKIVEQGLLARRQFRPGAAVGLVEQRCQGSQFRPKGTKFSAAKVFALIDPWPIDCILDLPSAIRLTAMRHGGEQGLHLYQGLRFFLGGFAEMVEQAAMAGLEGFLIFLFQPPTEMFADQRVGIGKRAIVVPTGEAEAGKCVEMVPILIVLQRISQAGNGRGA